MNLTGSSSKQSLFSGPFFWVILLVFVAINISGLFDPLIGNASKYAQVSREILDNQNWINLTIAHEPYDQKPPLLFWLGAFFYSLFGVSFISFKIPVLLISAIGIYSTYRLAKLLYNSEVGLLAAFLWGTSLGYLHFHNDIHTDTVLADFVMLAVWQFTAFFRFKKWHQFLLGSIGVGLAMLSKGPIGLAIPVAALGLQLLVHRKFREIFHLRWLLAIPIVGIIILPALIGLFNQFGLEGLKFYFWTNNVGRVTGSYRSSSSDMFFYFHNLILMVLPWFMFVYPGLIMEIRKYILKIFRREKWEESDEVINIGGFGFMFIILTIASQKNPHYMMAILPFAMIISAKWMLEFFNQGKFKNLRKGISVVNYIYPVLMVALILLVMFWIYPESRIWFWIIFALALSGLIIFWLKYHGLKKQMAILLMAQTLFLLSFNISIFPSILGNYSTFKACQIFNEEAGEDEVLHSYRVRLWSLFYYSKSYGEWITEGDKLREVLAQDGVWIFTDQVGLDVLDKWKVNYTLKGDFNHRSVTGQTPAFLNPKTRAQHFQKNFLVKIK